MENNINILGLHIKVLRYLLLWPRLTRITNNCILFGYFCLNVPSFSPVVLAVLYQCFVGISDVNILLEALIAVCDTFGYMVAYVCFLRNKVVIENIMKDINIFLLYCHPKVIEETDAVCARYTKYMLSYVSVGLAFNLTWPLISRKYCIAARGSDFYLRHDPCGMPTHNYYPFDASEPKVFWIVFLIEAVYVCHICYVFSMVTATILVTLEDFKITQLHKTKTHFGIPEKKKADVEKMLTYLHGGAKKYFQEKLGHAGLLMHIIAQLKNCSLQLENINYQNDETNTGKKMKQEFEICVRYHQAILAYAKRTFSVFSAVVASYITITSFATAVIGYQIVQSDNIQDRIRYTMLLFGWGLLFFLICLYADKVQEQSIVISNSVYNSEWNSNCINNDIRRNIIMVMARAQHPLYFKIPFLGIISLSRFVIVMKTAYSFFTILLTVTDKN